MVRINSVDEGKFPMRASADVDAKKIITNFGLLMVYCTNVLTPNFESSYVSNLQVEMIIRISISSVVK